MYRIFGIQGALLQNKMKTFDACLKTSCYQKNVSYGFTHGNSNRYKQPEV